MTINPVVELILWESLVKFLLVTVVAGIAVSLLMLFRPKLMARINGVANRWVSTEALNQTLDRSILVEQWFYRHHRLLGMMVCLGAVYVLVYFGLLFDKSAALRHLPSHLPARFPPQLLEGLLDALVLASLTGAAVSLFVGLLLSLRPSMLRGLDETANQWVSMSRYGELLDVPRGQMDSFVERHTQRVGWLLLLGSILLLLMMMRALF